MTNMKQVGKTGIAVSSILIPVGWATGTVALISAFEEGATDEQINLRINLFFGSIVIPPTLLVTFICVRIIYR